MPKLSKLFASALAAFALAAGPASAVTFGWQTALTFDSTNGALPASFSNGAVAAQVITDGFGDNNTILGLTSSAGDELIIENLTFNSFPGFGAFIDGGSIINATTIFDPDLAGVSFDDFIAAVQTGKNTNVGDASFEFASGAGFNNAASFRSTPTSQNLGVGADETDDTVSMVPITGSQTNMISAVAALIVLLSISTHFINRRSHTRRHTVA